MTIRFRPTYANVASTLALVAALGGTAIATTGEHQASSSQVYACAAKKGAKKGLLRSVSRARCKRSERLVSWSARGPQGERGATGASGPAGTQGPAGPQGAPGAASGGDAPAGAVMAFNRAACPAGWTEYSLARGRYVVGLQPGGAVGAVTGAALADGENRATGEHTHGVNDPGHGHTANVDAIISGGNVAPIKLQGSANTQTDSIVATVPAGSPAPTGITIASAGAAGGTNAPYVQLQMCEKG